MAHFAQLDENNVVTQVIVVHNNDCQIDGVESEDAAILFCKQLFGADTNWKQTSYNTIGGVHTNNGTPFRKNYAAVGYSYDAQRDAFIPPKLFASWSLNEDSCLWVPPSEMPIDGNRYSWSEEAQAWVIYES